MEQNARACGRLGRCIEGLHAASSARAAWVMLAAALAAGCADAPRAPAEARAGAGEIARAAARHAADQRVTWGWAGGAEEAAPDAPRGFGTMTARVPGTRDVVEGVRLVAHHVTAVVQGGFARTTVEEEFHNDTGRVLEGRYMFPLPPDASISRLALWVGSELVEGEMVERPRAARIFQGIVDDTVRPRDPALLEWVSASEFSLKIFPIPPKGSRKVILAYDQALPEAGERVRYVYPLSLGQDRATTIDAFSITVSASDAGAALHGVETPRYPASIRADEGSVFVRHEARAFSPAADFVVSWSKRPTGAVAVSTYAPRPGQFAGEGGGEEPGFFAFRLQAELPDGAPSKRAARVDRAIVVDASHSQSKDTLEAATRLAATLVRALEPDERFVLLACDSACATYPDDGLAPATGDRVEAAEAWLAKRAPGGSSDLAGAIAAAAERLEPNGAGQIVYVGDGAPTSGELRVDTVAARVAPALRKQGVDLRLLGLGRTVDETTLGGLAHALGATYDRVANGAPLARRNVEIARELRAPVIQGPQLLLPEGLYDVHPRRLPNLRVGQEIVATGRMRRAPTAAGGGDPAAAAVVPASHAPRGAAGATTVTLTGTLAGAPFALEKPVRWAREDATQDPLLPRLWARAKIAALEASPDADAEKEAVRVSTTYHVMSRATSLLVLESEQMFAEFGIRRTQRRIGEPGAATGAPAPDAASERVATATAASEFGAIGLLGAGAAQPAPAPIAPTSPWGKDDKSPSAKGSLWGDGQESFGAGGLGLTGVGEGGGGKGEGIGLGSVGVIGRGAGTGTGQGFGSGHGRLGGSHKSTSPQVRMGSTAVSGRLPPEVIQRIVRMNFGRFRVCYENGLRKNPNLQGRIAVRFVIGADGNVGSAGNGGSDLPDAGVVSCVVSAFQGLSFPSPEGGIVTVVYPIVFSPGGESASTTTTPAAPAAPPAPIAPAWSAPAARPVWTGPSVVHRAGGDAAPPALEPALDKLRAAAGAPGAPRKSHDALVRKLLGAGRLDEALSAATRFADLDPDHDAARELFAFAAAVNGRAETALAAVDALSETTPRSAARHARAARAFEAASDERRACAHWRALAELAQRDEGAQYEALRCRARVMGQRDAALEEARAAGSGGGRLAALVNALEQGAAPAFDPAAPRAGQLEAKLTCSAEGAACPTLAVIGPNGDVVSTWTPGPVRTDRRAVALASLRNGTYRTVVAGGAPGTRAAIEIQALGVKQTFHAEAGAPRTLATTLVRGIE